MKTLQEVREAAKTCNVIPLVQELLSDQETPITALRKIREESERYFLLESVETGEKLARYSFLGKDPLWVFSAKGDQITLSGKENKTYRAKALEELKSFMNQFRGFDDPALPAFAGGAVGFACYDSIRLIEDIPDTGKDDYNLPDLLFGLFTEFLVFDHIKHRLLVVANVLPDEFSSLEEAYQNAISGLDGLQQLLTKSLGPLPRVSHDEPEWDSNMTRAEYEKKVEVCQEYIRAGDAFQIVLSQRFSCRPQAEALYIYRALRAINPSPYMYFLHMPEVEIVGASPETLVKVQKREVETKPIAGTRHRGADDAEDKALAEDLLADEKEKAEHVMLVDLGRNDIGRVCEFGSVSPTQFMEIERLSHVMHISSVVKGKLRPEIHCLDALMACLPAGTLSGAPKIRAMEIIDELEPHRRGIYGGTICYMDFRGNLDSCIAIRTLVLKEGNAYVQAGAGIVADSKPDMEFEETGHKARALIQAVSLAARI